MRPWIERGRHAGQRLAQALEAARGVLQVLLLRLLDERVHDERPARARESVSWSAPITSRPAVGPTTRVATGARPCGRSRRTECSRSPNTVSASERGIGVADMASRCGLSAFCVSARRWPTPKRCCSSITASPSRGSSTDSENSACVPTTIETDAVLEPARELVALARRRRAGEQAPCACRAAPPSRENVCRCCSASSSVGASTRGRAPRRVRRGCREHREHGLARADVADQQAVHRRRAREVGADLRPAALLVGGERERQRRARVRLGGVVDRERRGAALRERATFAARDRAAAGTAPLRRAAGGRACRARAARSGSSCVPGRCTSRSAAPISASPSSATVASGSQPSTRSAAQRTRGLDDPAHAARRESLDRAVARRRCAAARRAPVVGRERLDVGMVQLLRVAEAAHLAGHQHARARREARLEVREPAKPLELHRGGAVGHDRLEEAPAVAQRHDTGARHGAREAGRAPDLELRDRHDLAAILVGARQEEEQVLDGARSPCARAPAPSSDRRPERARPAAASMRVGKSPARAAARAVCATAARAPRDRRPASSCAHASRRRFAASGGIQSAAARLERRAQRRCQVAHASTRSLGRAARTRAGRGSRRRPRGSSSSQAAVIARGAPSLHAPHRYTVCRSWSAIGCTSPARSARIAAAAARAPATRREVRDARLERGAAHRGRVAHRLRRHRSASSRSPGSTSPARDQRSRCAAARRAPCGSTARRARARA